MSLHFSLRTKLISAFMFISLIVFLVGLCGIWQTKKLAGHIEEIGDVRLPSVQHLLLIANNLETIYTAQRTLSNPGLSEADRKAQFVNIENARQNYQKSWKIYEALPQTEKEADLWKNQFQPAVAEAKQENDRFFNMAKTLEQMQIPNPLHFGKELEIFRANHYQLMSQVLRMFFGNFTFEGGDDYTSCPFEIFITEQNYQNPAVKEILNAVGIYHHNFHNSIKTIKKLVAEGDTDKALTVFEKEMLPSADEIIAHMQKMIRLSEDAELLYEEMNAHSKNRLQEVKTEVFSLLEQIIRINTDEASASRQKAAEDISVSETLLTMGIICGFFAALFLGIILSRRITLPLQQIAESLSQAAGKLRNVSEEGASTSRILAEGASEQAAAIEETGASFEEISSITRQHADNSRQADHFSRETADIVSETAKSMLQVRETMQKISAASSETTGIIKSINEIAFQTNLLSLNASVEAVRAGETGAGFAVVAGEVRNLARQASEAANTTADLIEQTGSTVEEGNLYLNITGQAFEKVVAGVEKISVIISEISSGADEQYRGIEEVNRAIAEVDKVIQKNAAIAEESASASRNMHFQSEIIEEMIEKLKSVIGGKK